MKYAQDRREKTLDEKWINDLGAIYISIIIRLLSKVFGLKVQK